jgi:NAD(P)-dependent dehydrogenase (short-subunit alcohol dehydrogenase family)
MKLKGKRAIVTGGAMGIGRAIAEALAAEGASVAIADVSGAEAAAQAIRATGGQAIGVKVDVSSEEDTRQMAQATVSAFGGIDILVNNAGIFSSLNYIPFERISLADWHRVMEVNVAGMFLSARAVVPHLREGGGRILNIGSATAFKGTPFMLHYVTSKGAVVSFTRALAQELGRSGILVNSIAPGFTMSEGVLRNPSQYEFDLGGITVREYVNKQRVVQRDMLPADILGAALFLCGPESSFVTGQSYVIDGGMFFH